MIRVVVLAVVAWCAVAGTAFAQGGASVERGQQVFGAQKCAICHSVAGKGNQKGPLDSVGTRLTADEIRLWIVNATEMAAKTGATRKPPMKAYTTLAKEDLEALVAYLLTLKK
jgi:mono/diheme cytochrome c family protein